ncbi:PBP1A family penicillin-binding protein [Bacillus aquiflavi]|uniref:PBP1A family penicillin-binding protein n=1 Tax=Bacillus aquiflavi TaxID=2672567 RepID=A0A6B3VZ59_9BACI|nr:PBP1A family penicillin-binding protein [Bacillus aquiflavi]MBA4536534.1 PBP1A family penicillin-binding protein [Bacillus aquiflavi]NEY80901.1 PBP1A family penicillin-binding protein [Bacillus aquiflavi]
MERLQKYKEAIRRFWRKRHLTQILLLIFSSAVLFLLLYFGYHAVTANVQSLKDGLAQSTIIYDKDGDVASKVSVNMKETIQITDIPKHVQNAVIAIEDHRFYEHNGFDIKGMARAFLKNIFAGRITGGGSTLTQQLTKNALLSPEKTYKRKVEELFLAVEIEKNYSKDEILQMYLNQVYFGSGAWGIDSAAQKYFAKEVSELTISEAALLAGLLKSPSALDPFKHYERAIERRDVVLGQMKEYDLITKDQYEKAKKEKIVLKDGGSNFAKGKYPYYVDAVLDEAINKYGLTQDEIVTRGYQIYTEMDQNLQVSIEKVYERDSLFPKGRRDAIVQSGAVLLDPETGGVRGLVGGRGTHVFRGFNRATHLKAQPGSTLKPLAVYAPALEEGYTINSMLVDEPMSFGSYQPENFSKSYQGEVPMYKALEDSLNIPAVWLLNEIGIDKGMDALKRFGIPLEEEDANLSIGLGGMHKGVSPLELAEAYSVFPNNGKRQESHLITKIIGPTGNIIAEHKQRTVKVTSKAVTKKMTSMLLNVVETGTGQGTRIPGVEIAGKTGSTQLPYNDINGTKDQWFVGYTPNLVGAVWIGYDKTDRDHYLPSRGSDNVVPIFKAMMEQAVQYIEPREFEVASVNNGLEKDSTESIQKAKQQLKEKTEELKEESGKWKEKINKGINKLEDIGGKVKEKIKRFINE